MGTASRTLPPKKPACPAEKNLLYEFLGATKNPSGQPRLRNKVEVDGPELKRELTYPGRDWRGAGVAATLTGFRVALLPSGCLIYRQFMAFLEVSVFQPIKWGQ